MFAEIISQKNLTKAYLKLAEQMEADRRSQNYAGWDGLKLGDIELNSAKLIKEARQELINFKELSPAILLRIPKKSNPKKFREIYIYSLKDRIKAQAIYQVVEPYFDAFLSPYLFSYRASHPSYFAARSTVRHYKKYYVRDFLLVADASDYSSNIKRDLLVAKIKKAGFPDEVIKLFILYIENKALEGGEIIRRPLGLISGTPLTGLFANLYLDDFDKYCGSRVDFYRRVGDDLIIFDQCEERLKEIQDYLKKEAAELGIIFNEKKTKYLKASEDFEYLGYSFRQGIIGLGTSFIKNSIRHWQEQFDFYRTLQPRRKEKFLKRVLSRSEGNLANDFKQLAEQKKLVNDSRQIRAFSEAFFRILTRYFFGIYSPKNRRQLESKLKGLPLKSVYKYFLSCQYGYRPRTN